MNPVEDDDIRGAFMQLTQEQIRLIRAGQAVEVDDADVGATCLIVLAKAVRKPASFDDLDVPMEFVSRLVDNGMSDYDADDPLLESYQGEES